MKITGETKNSKINIASLTAKAYCKKEFHEHSLVAIKQSVLPAQGKNLVLIHLKEAFLLSAELLQHPNLPALVRLWPDSPTSWDVGINPDILDDWYCATLKHFCKGNIWE